MTARALRCAICERPVRPRAENRAFPFCSDRCRMVDLGRWMAEDYAIPGPMDPDALPPRPHGDDPDDR